MQIHTDLVDATVARLTAAGVCAGNVDKDRAEPASVDELPIAIVHVMTDKAKADGDARTGVPDFVHELALCVDIFAKGQSGAGVKSYLYAAGEAVMQALLADQGWVGIGEGINTVEQAYLLSKEGEFTFSGLRIEFAILHRTTWPPSAANLPDFDGLTIAIETGDGAVIGAEVELPGE